MNRRIVDAVEAAEPDMLVLDLSAVAMFSATAAGHFVDLEREVTSRGVTLWLAGVHPRMLGLLRLVPRWHELGEASQVHPTALAATRAYRAQ